MAVTISIGAQKLAIRAPADLDDRLIAATGCNAAEHAAMLATEPHAGHLARALHPFLDVEDGAAPAVQDLAMMIGRVGTDAVKPQVLALYSKAGEQRA